MLLNQGQVDIFWRLWAKACTAQGWDAAHGLNSAAVNAQRKLWLANLPRYECSVPTCRRVYHEGGKSTPPANLLCTHCHAPLVRTGFSSLTKVDKWEDFSLVKRKLLKLDDRIQGAREEVQPTIETARKARWVIENELLPCIAVYAEVDTILAGLWADYRFCWKIDWPHRQPFELDDLRDEPVVKVVKGQPREFPSQLWTLMTTLNGLLNSKQGLRATAGDSLHDMRMKAGIPCNCLKCCQAGPPDPAPANPEPVMAEDDPF